MNVLPLVAILLILAPLIEIWIMIDIGSVIGAGWTILAIVATALLGMALVRYQGLGVYLRLQQTAERGELPAMEMLEGLALLISGLLLLFPGFVTDTLGFLLLVPPLRRWAVLHLLRRQFVVPGAGRAQPSPGPGDARHGQVIEGRSRRLDDDR
jgi:UPF0716 protein FxsA